MQVFLHCVGFCLLFYCQYVEKARTRINMAYYLICFICLLSLSTYAHMHDNGVGDVFKTFSDLFNVSMWMKVVVPATLVGYHSGCLLRNRIFCSNIIVCLLANVNDLLLAHYTSGKSWVPPMQYGTLLFLLNVFLKAQWKLYLQACRVLVSPEPFADERFDGVRTLFRLVPRWDRQTRTFLFRRLVYEAAVADMIHPHHRTFETKWFEVASVLFPPGGDIDLLSVLSSYFDHRTDISDKMLAFLLERSPRTKSEPFLGSLFWENKYPLTNKLIVRRFQQRRNAFVLQQKNNLQNIHVIFTIPEVMHTVAEYHLMPDLCWDPLDALNRLAM